MNRMFATVLMIIFTFPSVVSAGETQCTPGVKISSSHLPLCSSSSPTTSTEKSNLFYSTTNPRLILALFEDDFDTLVCKAKCKARCGWRCTGSSGGCTFQGEPEEFAAANKCYAKCKLLCY